ncbi:hypothetical protein BDY19DRAFT_1051104 [Irpex rosettiformis]|uniref:Uncharacterized protein n=1 Tax=Irpex rosettiformis TaxID=378272 RepID=A0ACB8TSD8_9APHY|nr:hypothetical protein BDY19DRAFT_1051104 [Irpex rosettiformis]
MLTNLVLSYLLLTLFLSSLPKRVYAQSFAIPANWRKPTSPLSRHDRVARVNGLLDTILSAFNSSSGLLDGLSITQTASLLIALSNSDSISGSANNKNAVLQSLDTMFAQNPNISALSIATQRTSKYSFHPLSSPLYALTHKKTIRIWGLAAISAYRAYNTASALQHAQAMFDLLQPYQITPSNAANGTHPLRQVKFQGSCNGASTAGGVFYFPYAPQNADVNGETVGAFMALSAYLYSRTHNTTYLTSATLSATFIFNQLFNDVIIIDTIALTNCFTSPEVVSYNSGFVIEGLSVLAAENLPTNGSGSPGESFSYGAFLQNLTSTAVQNQKWTNVSDGVIIEGPSPPSNVSTNNFGQALKGIFIRGLFEAYNRTSPGSIFADYISSFITVQFNALQDLASTPNTNSYSSLWEGPPPPPNQILPWGQLAALDVLNSAVGLVPSDPNSPSTATTTSASGSTDTPSATPSEDSNLIKPRKNKTAIIAGSIVGVISFLAFSILAGVYMIRRKRKRVERMRTMLEETAVPYGRGGGGGGGGGGEGQMVERERLVVPRGQARKGVSGRVIVQSSDDREPSTPPPLSEEPTLSDSTNPWDGVSRGEVGGSSSGGSSRSRVRLLTADLPELLNRLNQIMLRLPPGGVEEEDPPEYES